MNLVERTFLGKITTLYHGIIADDNSPYVILQTDVMLSDFMEARLAFNDLLGKATNFTSHSYMDNAPTTRTQNNLPSLWTLKASVLFMRESSLGFCLTNTVSSTKNINFGSLANNYLIHQHNSTTPFLMLHCGKMPNPTYSRRQINIYNYNNGTLIDFWHESNFFRSLTFITSDVIYFWTENTNQLPVTAGVVQNDIFNLVGELEHKRLYLIMKQPSKVSGIVYDATGVPTKDKTVLAFNRSTYKLVGKAISGQNGSYVMPLLCAKSDELFMVSLDDDGIAPNFEAQIRDRVTVG